MLTTLGVALPGTSPGIVSGERAKALESSRREFESWSFHFPLETVWHLNYYLSEPQFLTSRDDNLMGLS